MKRISIDTIDYSGKFAGLVDIHRPVGSVEISECGVILGQLLGNKDLYVEGMQICTGYRMGTITIS